MYSSKIKRLCRDPAFDRVSYIFLKTYDIMDIEGIYLKYVRVAL